MKYRIYKIKNPEKEEYSSGLRHGFIQVTKKGKSWNEISHIKNHLIQAYKFDKRAFGWYNNWEILKITENGIEKLGTVAEFVIS